MPIENSTPKQELSFKYEIGKYAISTEKQGTNPPKIRKKVGERKSKSLRVGKN